MELHGFRYKFWTAFMHEICPQVIVESKMNNRELVKAVKGLTDKENRYIIALDNSFDNVQIYMEQKILKEAADKRNNVFLLNFICFEYTLLEFDKLIDWIYAPEDEFREKRAGAIAAREKLVQIISSNDMNYKAIQEILDYDSNLHNHNIEQLSAKLLFDLTRNTGLDASLREELDERVVLGQGLVAAEELQEAFFFLLLVARVDELLGFSQILRGQLALYLYQAFH